MPDWRDAFNNSSQEDTPDDQGEETQHPALEALAQPLMKLQDFMHSGDDNKNLGSLHGQYVRMFDALGVGSLGNTLHRFALGDKLKHTPGSGDEMALDLLGSLPVGFEGANLAKGGLRAALEASVRADGKTALGMFTGQHAATSDLGALEKARLMSAAGKAPEEIHSATGWFKGKDGQWRQEIDDSTSAWKAGEYRRNLRQNDLALATDARGAREAQLESKETGKSLSQIWGEYERDGIHVNERTKQLAQNMHPEDLTALHEQAAAKYHAPLDAKLGDVLQHQRLFDAYPDLKDMPVHFNDLGPYIHGQMNTGPFPKMRLNSRNAFGPEGHETTLHEIQHQIQHDEGFDPGDSEARILSTNAETIRGHAQYEDTIQAAIDIRNGNDLFRHINPDAAELADDKSVSTAMLQDHLNTMQRNRPTRISATKAREMYNAAGGEVEARATEKRRKLSQAERRDRYPMSDYDVPSDQILLRNRR